MATTANRPRATEGIDGKDAVGEISEEPGLAAV